MHLRILVHDGLWQIGDLEVIELPDPRHHGSVALFLQTPLLFLGLWHLGGGRVSGGAIMMVFDGEILRNHT